MWILIPLWRRSTSDSKVCKRSGMNGWRLSPLGSHLTKRIQGQRRKRRINQRETKRTPKSPLVIILKRRCLQLRLWNRRRVIVSLKGQKKGAVSLPRIYFVQSFILLSLWYSVEDGYGAISVFFLTIRGTAALVSLLLLRSQRYPGRYISTWKEKKTLKEVKKRRFGTTPYLQLAVHKISHHRRPSSLMYCQLYTRPGKILHSNATYLPTIASNYSSIHVPRQTTIAYINSSVSILLQLWLLSWKAADFLAWETWQSTSANSHIGKAARSITQKSEPAEPCLMFWSHEGVNPNKCPCTHRILLLVVNKAR